MSSCKLEMLSFDDTISLNFSQKLTLYDITALEKQINSKSFDTYSNIIINLQKLSYIDTAASIFLNNLINNFSTKHKSISLKCTNQDILETLNLIKKETQNIEQIPHITSKNFIEKIGYESHQNWIGFLSFMEFLGRLFATKLTYFCSLKHIRVKEIIFEINESAIKALGIVALTSFLIGLVIAYQSAFQLKIYGANIFIVDMLGISILREFAPLITAIVIAGRSGSAFTAQIGAMKITQELDAMETMGFDPYIFLVLPRIIALMVSMVILIFVADMMGVFGGMLVANIDLNINSELFLDRFREVVAAKHFFIGLIKGPFFAFLISSIALYRGLMVRDNTQSIGINTTKSVVESIFAVIVCDAVFSILFTKLGI